MFGKLIKYEWKAVMRSMLPIYGALAAISVINAFLFSDLLTGNGAAAINLEQGFLDQTQMVAMLLYTGILVVMGVFTVMIVIRRFYSGLLKREGYLMFTLPVKPWQLVLSKALVACIVCMLSFLVAFFSIGCYVGGNFFVALIELPGELLNAFIKSFIDDAILTVNGTLMVIELSLIHISVMVFLSRLEQADSGRIAVAVYAEDETLAPEVIGLLAVSYTHLALSKQRLHVHLAEEIPADDGREREEEHADGDEHVSEGSEGGVERGLRQRGAGEAGLQGSGGKDDQGSHGEDDEGVDEHTHHGQHALIRRVGDVCQRVGVGLSLIHIFQGNIRAG